MNTLTSKLAVSSVLFLLTLVSGVAVSKAGRPLNSGLFAIHKIVAVSMIIIIIIAARQFFKSGNTAVLLELTTLILTGLFFLSLVVTGGFLSFEMALPSVVLKVHQVAPVLFLATSVLTVYLLISRNG